MKKINDESEKINQPSAASDTVDTEDGIYFNINHVAKTLDIVPATIRNWEKAGLFTAKRRGNNYRVFDINDIALLRRIKKYSVEENMSMSLIKKILANDTLTARPVKQIHPKSIYYSKLREYREKRGYTLEDAAGIIDISASYLCKVERGQANISLDLLQKLAEFYGESLLTFMDVKSQDTGEVLRSGEGIPMETLLNGVEVKSLSYFDEFKPVMFTVAPGCGDFKSHKHMSGQEFIYVLSGKLQVTLDDKNTYLLKDDDSIHFASTRMHNWHNAGKSTLKMLWMHSSL